MSNNQPFIKKTIVIIDFAAVSGGGMSILSDYYNRAEADKNNYYVFLLNDYYFSDKKNIRIIVLKKEKKWINRLIFDYISGGRFVNSLNPNQVISLQNTMPRGVKCCKLLYIQQSIPFQKIKDFSFIKRTEIKLAIIQHLIGACIKHSAKKADKIIVQTDWMKRAVIRDCKINSKKVEVVKPHIESNLIIKAKNIDYSHFFYPTSYELYKNNDIIYQAVELLRNEGINDFLIEMTLDGKSTKNIKKIGIIDRKMVFKKYSNSVLLFPSYIETIGLPLLEAMCCGTIIIAADTEFSREVLRKYNNVYYFNAFDKYSLCDIMKKCIDRKKLNSINEKKKIIN